MTQQDLVITTEDIQTVLRSDPNMALRVQNQALMRKLAETQAEVDRLTRELEDSRIEAAKQELASHIKPFSAGMLKGGKNKKGG